MTLAKTIRLLSILTLAAMHTSLVAADPVQPAPKKFIFPVAPPIAAPNNSVVDKRPLPIRPLLPERVRWRGSISGILSTDACDLPFSEWNILLDGHKQRNVRLDPVPGNRYATRYTIENLEPGTYEVAVRFPPGRCAGGRWNPPQKKFTVSEWKSVSGADFRYVWNQVTRKSLQQIAMLVSGFFYDTEIRLNNHGPKRKTKKSYTWYKHNDSYVQLNQAAGGRRVTFTIDPLNVQPWRFYVHDINLQNVRASAEGGRLKLSFNFEGRGPEIKGQCAGGGAKDAACVLGRDDSTPDAEITGRGGTFGVEVLLRPVLRAGSLSYGPVESRFRGQLQVQGICNIGVDVCNAITGYKSRFYSLVNGALRNALNDDRLRDLLARELRPVLDSWGVGRIVELRTEGDTLVITHRRI